MVGAPDCPVAPEPVFIFNLQLAPDDPSVFKYWRRSNLIHMSVGNRDWLALLNGAPDDPLASKKGRRSVC